MKTSNIILLAVFGSILIWILAAFMTAKSKMNEIIEQHPEFIQKDNKDIKGEIFQLELFNTIVANGKGKLNVNQSDVNTIEQIPGENIKTVVINDTLFIELQSGVSNLNVLSIKNVVTKDYVRIELNNIKSESFNLSGFDNSRVDVNDLKTLSLSIKANDNSKIILNDLNSKGMNADFFLKNFSVLEIHETEGMNISVKKDSDAKYIEK